MAMLASAYVVHPIPFHSTYVHIQNVLRQAKVKEDKDACIKDGRNRGATGAIETIRTTEGGEWRCICVLELLFSVDCNLYR